MFLFGFSIAGLRNETEAASNTASTFSYWKGSDIINHTFRVYKCACINSKVGKAAKLRRENLDSNVQQTNEGSNIRSVFPALLQMCTCTCLWPKDI